jgi:hypothetical protein
MRFHVKYLVVPSVLALMLLGLSGCSGISAMTPGKMEWIKTESDAPRAGNVYLVRGLIGFFSAGIDSLTEEIDQSGVRAHVFQEDQRELIAQSMVETYRNSGDHEPLILVGHSLGADDVLMISRELQKAGVEVDMLITLDCTRPDPASVPGNVKIAYNYYQPSIWDGTGILRGIPLTTDPDFKGKFVNMNVRKEYKNLLEWDTNHVNIDKNKKIHADVIAKIHEICPPRPQWVAARQARLASATTQPSKQATLARQASALNQTRILPDTGPAYNRTSGDSGQ